MKTGSEIPKSRLYELRKQHGLAQADVASRLDVTVKSYRSWEKGDTLPDAYNLKSLARLFNVSTDYILGLTDFTHVENEQINEITGLSNAAIEKLRLLNSRTNRLGERGVFADGIQIEEISLVDDLITSKRFHPLFNAISMYLIYGMSTPSLKPSNLEIDEYSKMYDYLRSRGLVITSKKDVREMYLQIACDELKAIYREISDTENGGLKNG